MEVTLDLKNASIMSACSDLTQYDSEKESKVCQNSPPGSCASQFEKLWVNASVRLDHWNGITFYNNIFQKERVFAHSISLFILLGKEIIDSMLFISS